MKLFFVYTWRSLQEDLEMHKQITINSMSSRSKEVEVVENPLSVNAYKNQLFMTAVTMFVAIVAAVMLSVVLVKAMVTNEVSAAISQADQQVVGAPVARLVDSSNSCVAPDAAPNDGGLSADSGESYSASSTSRGYGGHGSGMMYSYHTVPAAKHYTYHTSNTSDSHNVYDSSTNWSQDNSWHQDNSETTNITDSFNLASYNDTNSNNQDNDINTTATTTSTTNNTNTTNTTDSNNQDNDTLNLEALITPVTPVILNEQQI